MRSSASGGRRHRRNVAVRVLPLLHRGRRAGFVQMVRRLRIIRACHLLASTSMPISEICYLVGFGNLSNFNRQFRAETGTTPRRYRATARSGQGALM
nr:AraC family transcriptional regulator [Tessaracoccus coleopterorum]